MKLAKSLAGSGDTSERLDLALSNRTAEDLDYLEPNKRTLGLCFPSLVSLTLGACTGGGGANGGGGLGTLPSTPNRTPVAAADKTFVIEEDAVDQALSITAPSDPDGNSLAITVTSVPVDGTLKTADGTEVTSNATLTISQLTGLVFTPDANLAADGNQDFSNDPFSNEGIALAENDFSGTAIAAEYNPLDGSGFETITGIIKLPETLPVDNSALVFSEEEALSLLSELIDQNPASYDFDESIFLTELSKTSPLDQLSVDYSPETTGLGAEHGILDYDNGILDPDILLGISELG